LSPDWLRQYPRYLKAEIRRWQRNAARGGEAATLLRELMDWTTRVRDVGQRLAAESRWLPQFDELQQWLEEFRVSLYAQELKTLGPISAARLSQRIAEIDAWLQR
jgi:ATP-dependent helicase HrpA